MTRANRQTRLRPLHRRRSLRPLVVGLLAVVAALGVASFPGIPAAAAERREPPDVVGKTLPEAQALIQQQWYPEFDPTIRVTPGVPPQVPTDAARVVAQNVVLYREDSDDAKPTAIIELTVGSVVADLVGRTREEAQALLDALGLYLKPTGSGLVVRQDPPAKALAEFGTTVVAVLVPPTSNVRTVPRLRGLTEADARATVEGVDLVLRVGGSSGEGELSVTEQDPAAGTRAKEGDVVTVTLVGSSSPLPEVAVPDVTGLEPHVVQRVLDAAGLVLVVDPSGAQNGGLSFRQDPEAGLRIASGDPVTVAFAVVADSGPASWLGWPAGAALLAAVLVGVLAVRAFRSRRPPRPPPAAPDVRVDPRPDPAPVVSLHPQAADAELVVRIVPGPDLGRLTLTEESR